MEFQWVKPTETLTKYIPNRDIDTELISVLIDLRQIKRSNPDMTLEQVLKQSHTYQNFITHLIPRKISKYKQKIFYYWRVELA